MYIGIDLGGTNIAVGLVSEEGKIISSASTPTLAQRPYQEIVADMGRLSQKLIADAGYKTEQIKGIGIGSPGTVDNEHGIVTYSNNLPFANTPLAAELNKYLDIPVNIENDANAAAYGEYVATGAKSDSFIFITLGTGVGGGIVLGGKIYRGFNCAGGELGHFTMIAGGEPCTCGNRGCWESYASVTALIRQTEAAMKANPESLMHKIAEEEGKISGRTAFRAEDLGDEAGRAVVDKYIEYVATGIASMVNIFQPETIVIGGGISKEGDRLLIPIKELVNKMDYNKYMPKTEIQIAKLYNDAGIVGAALAARK
ncbi:MAG: ROK family protein [Clostridia bacterium]|nr:ROK family protein [Clostridia bacterium]